MMVQKASKTPIGDFVSECPSCGQTHKLDDGTCPFCGERYVVLVGYPNAEESTDG